MKYWDARTENAIRKWKDANTLEQFHIYNQILPDVKYMAISILRRYFYVNSSDAEEVMWGAINKLFLELHKYDCNRKENSYSFAGTVMRNYMINVCRKKKVWVLDIEYIDDLETRFEYSYVINPYQENNYDYNQLFARLSNSKQKLVSYIGNGKIGRGGFLIGLKNEIRFLDTVQEFLHKYIQAQGLSRKCIYEACSGLGLSSSTLNKYLKKHLGFTSSSVLDCEYSDYNYVDDDYCPIQNEQDMMLHRRAMRDMKYE